MNDTGKAGRHSRRVFGLPNVAAHDRARCTGTHGSLLDAGNFVRTLTERQGLQVGCPDEIAYRLGWIDRAGLAARAETFRKNDYGRYLAAILAE